ncbi:GNAT family N-acetyltransferase [Methanobacterium congolense]|uniref:N-acetyltransferase GCN5 n=1 Tax=Methanobacterium congolense TaxID=118062 RepID=A0A1D3L573_9EURY|nr:GNAT family N-acetyltransferase [Methanobacterium congolense]SCG86695.1 N-acetyltransferase GCN5 [Methanobacterium congolense]
MEISYIEGNEKDLDLIQPLWEKLRQHHQKKSEHFQNHYQNFDFQERKEDLLKKSAEGSMRVDLAEDPKNRVVGYCVSSLSTELEGEIDSIYVDEAWRSEGIGSRLMERALEWMDENHVKKRRILVANGNEEALEFYERYGFYHRATVLEQINH